MDYVIRNEFIDSFKEFLEIHQGKYSTFTRDVLMRFFEFFSIDWSESYLESVISGCFKIKHTKNLMPLIDSTPYGLSEKSEISTSL